MQQLYQTIDGKAFTDLQTAATHEDELYRRWRRSDRCQPRKILADVPLDNPHVKQLLRETFEERFSR